MKIQKNHLLLAALWGALSLFASSASHAQPGVWGQTAAAPQTIEARNKAVLRNFYDRFFIAHDVQFALEAAREDYIQHNPTLPTGRQALIDRFTTIFAQAPQSHVEVIRMVAEGDLVWVHTHQTNNASDPGRALIDIYRLQDGKLAEHWDAITPVSTSPANSNGQF